MLEEEVSDAAKRLPTLFVSHGAPTYALEGGLAAENLRAAVTALPVPTAVLVVSAHWITRGACVAVSAAPRTIHDFGGFPEPLYRLQYPAPGAPDVARRAVALLGAAGWPASEDADWGLDHGAWVPLMHMWPEANVPVLQVSMPHALTPESALRYGQALSALRAEGVLIMGSGSLTHNLRHMQAPGSPPLAYVSEFVAHCKTRVERNDRAGLAALMQAPHARLAHPSLDHILPLFVALGASAGERCEWVEGGVRLGALSMDSMVFY